MKDYYIASKYTEAGYRNGERKENEDSCFLKYDKKKRIKFFAIIADGVGGLNKGKKASSQLVDSLSRWYEQEEDTLNSYNFDELRNQFEEITTSIHEFIKEESRITGLQMGSTLTALCLTEHHYFVTHIGDSRAYLYDGQFIKQITKDQTVLQAELDAGKDVPEEERKEKGSTLLQCVGVNSFVPSFYEGNLPAEYEILLCSDGMINTLKKNDLIQAFLEEKSGKQKLMELTDLARERKETDDITSIYIARKKKED